MRSLTAHARAPNLMGPGLAIGAGVVWSLGALLVRSADGADAWQYLLWRSIGIVVITQYLSSRRGGGMALRRSFATAPMIVAGLALGLASLAFIYAMKNTTAANAVLLGSIAPLITAVLARAVLGEQLTRVTSAALAVGLAGLVVMVAGDLDAGNMRGNVSAIVSSVGFAIYAVCLRSDPGRDWSPALPGYALMTIVLCVPVTVVNGETLVPPAESIAYAIVHGSVLIVVGMLLFNIASRSVSAVAMTIFAQSEAVFAPLWVLLRFGERPRLTTVIGGAIVLLAVIGRAVLESPPPRGPRPDGEKPTEAPRSAPA